jgi:hypothetical protein
MEYVNYNARSKNDYRLGNTVEAFDKLSKIIQTNDGVRDCGTVVNNCYQHQAPFDIKDFTFINITTPTYDINNLKKSFITGTIRVPIQITGLISTFSDADHLAKLWIGFKASNQTFD